MRELSGVTGVDEHSMSFTQIFGGSRQDCNEALVKIAEEFDYTVTRENFAAIIARAEADLVTLKEQRPVKDTRRTPEVDAELKAQRVQAQAEREKLEEEKRAAIQVEVAKLNAKYPWARNVRAGKSDSAGAAACLRYELASKFPGCRISVTSEVTSIDVRWELGPKVDEVKDISGKYQNASFDGMTDSTNYDHSVEGEAVSAVLGRVRFVSISRNWPVNLVDDVAKMICAAVGVEFSPQKYGIIPDRGHNESAEDHAYQLLHKTSFGAGESVKGVELCEWVEGESNNDTWHWCKIVTNKGELPAVTSSTESTSATGAKVRHNAEHNGVEIEFPGKPEAHVIKRCKEAGFRWSPRSKVWYKKLGTYAWASAHTIAGIEPAAPYPTIDRESPEQIAQQVDRFDMQVEDNMAEQCGL